MAVLSNDSNTFVREFAIFNTTLNIHQAFVGDVGCVVWDAAIVLAKYLEKTRHDDLKSKKILELGAGTGIVGLCCCLAGADVLCTDLKELLSLLELNMTVNKTPLKGKFEFSELKWGKNLEAFHPVDFLVMSDVIYYEESLQPLLDTIRHLSNENTEILISYEERLDGNKPFLRKRFFEILEENFHIYHVPLEDQDATFQSSDIHIMSLKQRKQC